MKTALALLLTLSASPALAGVEYHRFGNTTYGSDGSQAHDFAGTTYVRPPSGSGERPYKCHRFGRRTYCD